MGKHQVQESSAGSYKDMLGKSCRRCINYEFGIHLLPEDVMYMMDGDRLDVGTCSFCHQQKHIVTGLRFPGKLKMITRKR